MTPFLAHNLGLEYHAAPFYATSLQQGGDPASPAQQAGLLTDRPSYGAIRLSRWQGSSSKASRSPEVPVAHAVWVSSIRQPDASFLQSQLNPEDGPSAAAQELSSAMSEKQQHQQQGSKQADDSLENALVAALQSYFQQHPR